MLAAGTGALASHRSAAWLWGADVEPVDPVDVIVPKRGRSPLLEGVAVHRPVDLRDLRVVHHDEVPCSTAVRVALDIGAVLPVAKVADVVDHLVVRRAVTIGQLRRALHAHGRSGRHGVGPLRCVLDEWALGDVPPDSVLEAAMARLLRRAQLPDAVFHHRVHTAGGTFELDFAIIERRLDLEVDGWAWHGSRVAQQRDRRRDAYLVAAGWTVLRFTWHQVLHRPDEVVAIIRATVDARS